MDIEKEMYIWVETIFQETKNGIVLDGNSFDDELGFGLEKRGYEGRFVQISKGGKLIDSGRVGMIHYSHYGLKWIMVHKLSFLKLPFLLTNNLSIRHIYSGIVYLDPSNEAEVALKKYPNSSFAIVSKQCIGNLYSNGDCFSIDIFSDISNFKLENLLTEVFCFSGYTESIGNFHFNNELEIGME